MKTITTSVLGFDVPVAGVPETLQEAIESAGGEENLVQTFVDQRRFHNTNTEARAAVVAALEKATGIKRKMKQVPSAKDPSKFSEQPDESEQQYSDGVRAQVKQDNPELKDAAAVTAYLWDAIKDDEDVAGIVFKGQGEGRGAGGPRTTKTDVIHATILLKTDADWQRAVAMLTQKNPGLVVELDEAGKPTVASLANALRINRARAQAEENAALGLGVAA
jgi:hypothetical protein